MGPFMPGPPLVSNPEAKKSAGVGPVRPAQHPTYFRRLPDEFEPDRTGADRTPPELETAVLAVWSPR